MKQAIQTKLLLLGVMVILFSVSMVGQSPLPILPSVKKQLIDFDIQIKVDKQLKNEKYQIQMINMDTKQETNLIVDNNFVLQLDYNMQYKVSVSGHNTSTKTIFIDTNAPQDDWYIISGFELKSDTDIKTIAGGIRYNKKSKTFEKYTL